jgi:hypothetical protein
MNNEFKRMQQLAGIRINEITPKYNGLYQRVLDKYVEDLLATQIDLEASKYLNSLKQKLPRAWDAEDTARKIQEINDALTKLTGESADSFYKEVVVDTLVDIGKENKDLRPLIKDTLEILHKSYNQNNTQIQQYNNTLLNQWRDN